MHLQYRHTYTSPLHPTHHFHTPYTHPRTAHHRAPTMPRRKENRHSKASVSGISKLRTKKKSIPISLEQLDLLSLQVGLVGTVRGSSGAGARMWKGKDREEAEMEVEGEEENGGMVMVDGRWEKRQKVDAKTLWLGEEAGRKEVGAEGKTKDEVEELMAGLSKI